MADVSVPSIATATPDGDDTVLGVKDGIVKRFSLDNVGAGINFSAVNATTNMVFNTNGTEKMRLDTAGNVGIGTSSPGTKLEVNGVVSQASQGTSSAQYRSVNTGGTFYYGLDSSTGASFGSAYAAVLWHSGNYPMIFAVNNGEKMRIDSAGNLGIGTTSPLTKLDVAGILTVKDGSGAVAGTTIESTNTGNTIIKQYYNGYMAFATNNAEKMRLDNAGNVGIGTTSPVSNANLTLGNDGTSGATTKLAFSTVATERGSISMDATGGTMNIVSGYAGYGGILAFATNGGNRMTIDASGNLIQTVNTTAATLTANNTLTFSIVDNSTLRISVRGSDGTTRTGTVALT